MVGSSSTIGFRFLVVLLYLFLLAPILVVIPISFAGDTSITFPPASWSLRWYGAMFQHEGLMKGFRVSLGLAAVVTVVSLAAGIPAAYALCRFVFPGRDWLTNLFTAPLLLPTIVLGLAILLVFVKLKLLGTFVGLVAAHSVITTPYVVRIMSTALSTLPTSVEEAATMLGARPGRLGGAGLPALLRRGGDLALRHRSAHLDAACRDLQLRRISHRPADRRRLGGAGRRDARHRPPGRTLDRLLQGHGRVRPRHHPTPASPASAPTGDPVPWTTSHSGCRSRTSTIWK